MGLQTKRFKIFSIILTFIICAIFVFPLIWMILASFKLDNEVWAYPIHILPKFWVTYNYQWLFTTKSIYWTRSLLVTGFCAVVHAFLSLCTETMAAYVFARLEFPGKKLFWRIMLFTMYIPSISILLTSFITVRSLGMVNTLWVLIIPSCANAGAIFFYRQYFLGVPRSLEEAALIDGASRVGIYRHVFLPNAKMPMVMQGTGTFIAVWNSFIWPSITISDPKKWQVMQLIRSFSTQYASRYGVVMAASVIGALPPIFVFLLFQRHIIRNQMNAGLK